MATKYFRNIWRTLAGVTSGSVLTYCTIKLFDTSPQQSMVTNMSSELSFDHRPSGNWELDWDCRAPKEVHNQAAGTMQLGHASYQKADLGEREKPLALRHIVLVRHGQYISLSDGSQQLTELGRLQAQHAGERLRELNVPWNHVVASNMTRAQETAMIILKEINFDPLKMKSCALLPEGTPCPGDPPQQRDPELVKRAFRRDGPRIEAAFRRYFFRASPEQRQDSYLLIIGHANVIRYLVCRALQFPPEAWTRMNLNHGSITWLTVWPTGYVSMQCLGDSGFMPVEHLTYRRPRPARNSVPQLPEHHETTVDRA